MQLARLWLQLGNYLDYWTGLHEPSISDALREILPVEGEDTATTDARLAATLPRSVHALFPQLLVNSEWPRVMLIHGSKDTAVPVDSSRTLHARLQDAKVETTLRIVPDMEHVFDLKLRTTPRSLKQHATLTAALPSHPLVSRAALRSSRPIPRLPCGACTHIDANVSHVLHQTVRQLRAALLFSLLTTHLGYFVFRFAVFASAFMLEVHECPFYSMYCLIMDIARGFVYCPGFIILGFDVKPFSFLFVFIICAYCMRVVLHSYGGST